MTARDGFERAARRAYRVLLHAYPSAFRDVVGDDVEETFVDRLRDARTRGPAATLAFCFTAIVDALANGAAERLQPSPRRAPMMYWQDVRYAVRLLTRSPMFTLLTIVVLGGGLALSIFTFSFVYSATIRPLPLAEGDRIVRVSAIRRGSSNAFDAADFAAMRSGIRTLTDVGVFSSRELIVGGESRPRVIKATAAEWNIFEATRTPPAIGRAFRQGDGEHGAEPVIVLSHRTWEVAFGADSAVIGRTVTINGASTRVIGVMPSGYGFPVAADAWVPIDPALLDAPPVDRYLVDVFARLAPSADAGTARHELTTLLARARHDRPVPPGEVAPTGVAVETFPMAQLGGDGPLAVTVLNVLALLILVLACINVTNLLLARANERARETAVRLALGASRPRLAMQSLWESALLCIAGGILATGGAAWGLSAINRWTHSQLDGNLAFWWFWHLDRTTFFAAGAFITLTIAVLGGVVSARAAGTQFNAVLRDGGARSGGRREGRIARILVATQIATVSVLLYFGVMSAVVAHRAANVDFGYDTRALLATDIDLPAERYATHDQRVLGLEHVMSALDATSAIEGTVLRARLADIANDDAAIDVGATTLPKNAVRPHAYVQAVAGRLATIGPELREGRPLDARDRASAVRTAVVSRAFAEKHWPRGGAIGAAITLSGLGEHDARTVVGVVSDVPLGNAMSRDRSTLAVYVPLAQTDASGAIAIFRHRGDAAAAQSAVYAAISSVDPLLAPGAMMDYAEVLGKSALIARSVTKLFAFCFGFALLLAVTGTYGLMARAIGRRTREIGVRRALGAPDGVIVRALLGQGGRQLGVGALVALPLMIAVGVGFAHYLPLGLTLAISAGVGVCAAIIGVVLAATYVPTRKAMAIAPSVALWRD